MEKIGLTETEYRALDVFIAGLISFADLVEELAKSQKTLPEKMGYMRRIMAELGIDAEDLIREHVGSLYNRDALRPTRPVTNDAVNHPGHYNQYEGFEVKDVCSPPSSFVCGGGGGLYREFPYL